MILQTFKRLAWHLSLAGLLVALTLAFVGQRLLLEPAPQATEKAAWFFGAAALVVLFSLMPDILMRSEMSPAAPSHRAVKPVLLIIGILLSCAGLGVAGWAGWLTFRNWSNIDRAIPFYGLGTGLALVGFALWDGYRPLEAMRRWRQELRQHWLEWLGFAFVLAAGLLLGLLELQNYPPPGGISWNDEAQMGKDAYGVLFHQSRPWQFATSIYPVAASFTLLGPTTYALRLPFVLMGSLVLIPFYFLARRFSGPLPALIATFLFAISRWRLAFVRMALPLTPDMFVELIAFACLARAAHTGGKAPYFWAGLALALGMSSHASFKLVLLFAVLLLAIASVRGLRHILRLEKTARWPALRRRLLVHGPGVLVWLISFAVFVAPYAGIAAREPRLAFTERFTSVMPVLFSPESANWPMEQLAARAQKVALFFNQSGETWPALNLPGTATLDPVTGVWFVLGLVVCLILFWRGWHLFVVAWLLVMVIGGGVLTSDFRSHRFADAMPAVFLLAGLFIAPIWQRFRLLFPRRPAVMAILLAPLLALASWFNLGIFFGQQVRDPRVLMEFDREIAAIAQTIADFHGTRYTYLFSNFPYYNPGHDFAWMTAEAPGWRAMDLGSVLPSREPTALDVAYIFAEPYADIGLDSAVRSVYPHAQYREVHGRYGGYRYIVVMVSREEVEARRGLTVRYWAGHSPAGPPMLERREANIDGQWDASTAPLPAPFVVEWRGALYAPAFGSYAFSFEGNGKAELRLDEQPVLGGSIKLAQGWHQLSVTCAVSQLPASARLIWHLPDGHQEIVPSNALTTITTMQGILASFYKAGSEAMKSELVWQRIEPVAVIQGVPTEWERAPIPQLAGQKYAVSLDGVIRVDTAGVYNFRTIAQGGHASLTIDGQTVIVNRDAARQSSGEGVIPLGQGEHAVRLDYTYEEGEFNGVALYWAAPGEEMTLIPPEAFVVVRNRPLEAGPPPPMPTPTPSPQKPQAQPEEIPGPPGAKLKLIGQFGEEGSALGQLREPWRIAGLPDGRLVVVDKGNHRIVVFDKQGRALAMWGEKELVEPSDVAVGSSGEVFVLDTSRDVIEVYAQDGKRRRTIGEGLGLYHPRGIALGADDTLYVADTGAHRVVVFSARGELLRQMGRQGSASGQLLQPAEVLVDTAGTIYAFDTLFNKRVQRFSPDGRPRGEWPLAWASDFIAPGLHYEPNSNTVYMTAPDRGELYHYTLDGLLLEKWPAEAFGEMRPLRPTGLFVDAEAGRMYMVDATRHTVLIYAMER